MSHILQHFLWGTRDVKMQTVWLIYLLQSFFRWFVEAEVILIDYELLWCLRDPLLLCDKNGTSPGGLHAVV